MILKRIIVSLFLFTFFYNAFAKDQFPTPNQLWIISDIAGKKFQPGDTCKFKVMAPDNYPGTFNINLRNRETPSLGGPLLTNVSFQSGLNTFELTIPQTASSPYYFINFGGGPTREDYSATFTIGDPGYGVSIEEPAGGSILHPGDKLIAKWSGSYEKPGVEGISFIHALLELAVNNRTRTYPFQADKDIKFEDHYFEYTLPDDLITNRVWKFGFLFNNSDGSYSTIVSGGSFLMLPKEDDDNDKSHINPDSVSNHNNPDNSDNSHDSDNSVNSNNSHDSDNHSDHSNVSNHPNDSHNSNFFYKVKKILKPKQINGPNRHQH
ncbi:hypothetical protein F8M41_019293 [Gigaspora margarita]|uniref:Uncharacterized protein n=1 Tax=Gigaspora margarita TaxID=4874 RepID=A0A8H4EKM0_GIGMA|nr:hypothetical protein F8M41_019293 [Gigaspora margarita]